MGLAIDDILTIIRAYEGEKTNKEKNDEGDF